MHEKLTAITDISIHLKVCPDCGEVFEWPPTSKVLCPKCTKERIRQRWRNAGRNKRDLCPICGTLKVLTARMCRQCYFKNAAQHLRSLGKGRVMRQTRAGRYAYWMLLKPEHPRATKQGYVREHIVIWEEAHGRYLPEGYVVHHLNGDPLDNRSENLVEVEREKHENQTLRKLWQRRIQELERELHRLKQASGEMSVDVCRLCGRTVRENGHDVTLWLSEEKGGDTTYTCAFCGAGVEPNSDVAIAIFGPYGYLPSNVGSYEVAIKKELGY